MYIKLVFRIHILSLDFRVFSNFECLLLKVMVSYTFISETIFNLGISVRWRAGNLASFVKNNLFYFNFLLSRKDVCTTYFRELDFLFTNLFIYLFYYISECENVFQTKQNYTFHHYTLNP